MIIYITIFKKSLKIEAIKKRYIYVLGNYNYIEFILDSFIKLEKLFLQYNLT